ncbi:peptidase domain-containing ABC transporter [Pontibacter silvestris]|nr:peptidase domain-containing ABC transporter [Pontibacter silvestris]
MVASLHGKKYSLQYLREKCFLTKDGVSLLGISEAAKKIGFNPIATRLTLEELVSLAEPCILHWNQNHFVVLQKVKNQHVTNQRTFRIADPGFGYITIDEGSFKKSWLSENTEGIALYLDPTEQFYKVEAIQSDGLSIKYFLDYLKPYKRQILQLLLLLLTGSGIALLLPVLMKNLIDLGVSPKNMGMVKLILMAQLALFVGSLTIEIFRNWIVLYVGARINISLVSDFMKKLLKLPMGFFETKMMGDFNQRIQDNERIEAFLTSQSLLTFFSVITLSAFLVILCYYDLTILLVYAVLTGISIIWFYYFLYKRSILDYLRFRQRSENQENIYEIFSGVTEMKLNQVEDMKRKGLKQNLLKLFEINLKILKLEQVQLSGFEFINQTKNIVVTFLAATYVINGNMSMGELLSVSFIIGQMNAPVSQLVTFFRSFQDAKLSLERLNEVQNHPEEEQVDQKPLGLTGKHLPIGEMPGVKLSDLFFQYGASSSPFVLKEINLLFPEGTTTAIVGASGSGKTTLMKLLLKFYEPTHGEVCFNNVNLTMVSASSLRRNCGVVMQDGFIFADTIERNIATSDELIDYTRLWNAIRIANLQEFIESLPLREKTKVGAVGNGISGGQKQRLLIARAVYKNPRYILLDEATSALDAANEKIIHQNLTEFFLGRTVIVIAHRLSTVKNADNIIVLKDGQVVEQGNHSTLVSKKAEYFSLIKNQLELGN